jgi:hypothetical protein
MDQWKVELLTVGVYLHTEYVLYVHSRVHSHSVQKIGTSSKLDNLGKEYILSRVSDRRRVLD